MNGIKNGYKMFVTNSLLLHLITKTLIMKTLYKQELITTQLTDQQIVKRIISGESELFEILIRRYNQTLFRVIRGYISDEDDIMDLIQDTYLKAYDKIDQFKFESRFSTWLIRIGINEALQWIRKSKNQTQMKSVVSLLQNSNGNNQESKTPEFTTIHGETKHLLEKAIGQIPEKYRIVFIMCEVENLPQLEVAACLGISISNTKVRLHRAKTFLRDQILSLSKDNTIFEFGNTKCDLIVEEVMKNIKL